MEELSPAVLFDLDGTLIDSLPGIASSYHHLFSELRMPAMSDGDIRALVGQNISVVLSNQFGLSGERLDRGVDLFRQHYASEGLYKFAKFDGIDEALENLRSDSVTLCIATSKLQHMAEDVVLRAGWSRTFAVVAGAERDGSRIHKRDIIAWSLGKLPKENRAVAMIGDRGTDIEGGRQMGLIGVGVTWGYGDRQELVSAGASAIVDSPDELLGLLRQGV